MRSLTFFGHNSWWLPKWLDRLLPHVDVEGEGLAHEDELADWPRPGPGVAIALDAVHTSGMDPDSRIDAEVAAGTALVIDGADQETRSSVLLALTGRLPVTEGRCKVAGLVLPTRASSVRAKTAVVRLDRPGHPIRRLGEAALDGPAVLAIDGAEALSDAATRTEVRRLLTEARAGAEARGDEPMTLVLTRSARETVDDLIPEGCDLNTLVLETSASVSDIVGTG